MLTELHVRDLALIEEAWLEFGPGMTVLTGETGAGKTVLLGALKLLLGERADSTSVRTGADEALVEGRFDDGVDEVLVKRRVSSDGRSRCVLNGEMATVGALAQRVGGLVDLHGQHEHQALLTPATHVGYLDRWAGDVCLAALAAYRESRARWREANAELADVRARVQAAARDTERLSFVVSEIERIDPKPDEDVELQARLPALAHAERLSDAASEAVRSLRGDEGALDRIAEAQAALQRVSGIDPALDALDERLTEAVALVDDIGASARAYRDSIEHDPSALDAVQARLSALSGLTKRYGPTLEAVLETWRASAALLAAAADGEGAITQAEAREVEARSSMVDSAMALDAARRQAAPGFTDALREAASDLAMDGCDFEVGMTELAQEAWTEDGPQRVEFLYAVGPGQMARPLARIASGGEISRVMLALKSVLGNADGVGTLVFDEVDAGIGGSTATAVGARLASLARTHQVVVVTHLAQVAAFADAHFVVRKLVDDEGAMTMVSGVEGEARLAEVARMLSGGDSVTALAHAAELLEGAQATSAR